MVAYALDGLGQEQQVEAGRDGARIFHHVGDEFAHEAVELLVDEVIFLEDGDSRLGVEPRQRVQRLAQQTRGQVGGHAQIVRRQHPRRAAADDGAHHARHLVGFVAHALQIGRGLGERNQHAQVARRGLAPRDDGRQLMVDLDFHGVDPLLGRIHLFGGFDAEFGQRIDGQADLRLNHAAELHDARGDAVEFGVELRREVFFCHVACLLSRNGQ
ncbi:hypothetical protein D3C80_1457980 [compost metagenome]